VAIPVAGQRFKPDDPVWKDHDDRLPVNDLKSYEASETYDFALHSFLRKREKEPRPAANVNTLGEVPDSAWFTNRHGRRRMSLEELTRGPDTGVGPAEGQWTVTQGKNEGVTPGFRIRDAKGVTYVVKFDPPANQEMASAAEVISTKFFHAMGYNVPENYLAFFSRSRLKVGERAQFTDPFGKERPMTEKDLDTILQRLGQTSGTYRALASRFVPGRPIGPFLFFGTRPDDPNDVFPHQDRRELRGLWVLAAWLNHNDTKSGNSLDTVIEEGGRRFLRHYLIDFGATLGSASIGPQAVRVGNEYLWEPKTGFARIFTFGLWDHGWILSRYPDFPSIGRFESQRFEAEKWRPLFPNPAFRECLAEDAYWAAKLVMAFTDDDIRVIVKTGRLSDRAAEEYLVRTLIERRDKIGRYWLTRVPSVDNFRVTANGLELDHLASRYGFAPQPAAQRVEWFRYDNATGQETPAAGPDPAWTVAHVYDGEKKVKVYLRGREVVGVDRDPPRQPVAP
jgi:hypothetical protein